MRSLFHFLIKVFPLRVDSSLPFLNILLTRLNKESFSIRIEEEGHTSAGEYYCNIAIFVKGDKKVSSYPIYFPRRTTREKILRNTKSGILEKEILRDLVHSEKPKYGSSPTKDLTWISSSFRQPDYYGFQGRFSYSDPPPKIGQCIIFIWRYHKYNLFLFIVWTILFLFLFFCLIKAALFWV
jgi:hypothetical protein